MSETIEITVKDVDKKTVLKLNANLKFIVYFLNQLDLLPLPMGYENKPDNPIRV